VIIDLILNLSWISFVVSDLLFEIDINTADLYNGDSVRVSRTLMVALWILKFTFESAAASYISLKLTP
jgi:hypothetical protein